MTPKYRDEKSIYAIKVLYLIFQVPISHQHFFFFLFWFCFCFQIHFLCFIQFSHFCLLIFYCYILFSFPLLTFYSSCSFIISYSNLILLSILSLPSYFLNKFLQYSLCTSFLNLFHILPTTKKKKKSILSSNLFLFWRIFFFIVLQFFSLMILFVNIYLISASSLHVSIQCYQSIINFIRLFNLILFWVDVFCTIWQICIGVCILHTITDDGTIIFMNIMHHSGLQLIILLLLFAFATSLGTLYL